MCQPETYNVQQIRLNHVRATMYLGDYEYDATYNNVEEQ